MYRLWVENEKKEKIELTNSMFWEVIDVDGLLPAKALINSTVLANYDGAEYNSSRVEERNIAVTIQPKFPIEENRQRLYHYFKTKKYVKLHFQNKNRYLTIDGIVEGFDGSLFVQKQTFIIDVRCFDPYFKEKNMNYAEMSTILDMFEFPFSIEEEGIEFSTIQKTLTQNIINYGDTETGLIIELSSNGEVINPIIYNADTRDYFGIKFIMQVGDLVRINTNNFKQAIELVRYGESRNIINNIIEGNKWFKLSPGDNLFTYACEKGDEFLNISFKYSNLYEGV